MAELSNSNFDLLLHLAADRVMASDVEQFDSIDTTGISISEKTEKDMDQVITACCYYSACCDYSDVHSGYVY